MMSWLRGTRSHERWERRAHAYVDGELKARDYLRFEQHLERCERCLATVDGVAELRASLQAMPEAAPPRSFRLTPEMVRAKAPARRAAPAPPAWAFRAAQVTAGIAIVGLFSVLTVDVLGGASGEGDDASNAMTTMASAGRGVADDAAGGGSAGGQAPTDTAAEGSPTDAIGSTPMVPSTIPPYDDGTGTGAGTNTITPAGTATVPVEGDATPDGATTTPSPAAPATGDPGEGHETVPTTSEGYVGQGDGNSAENYEKAAPLPEGDDGNRTAGGETLTTHVAAPEEPGSDKTLLRSLEALLAVVAGGAIVLAFFARARD